MTQAWELKATNDNSWWSVCYGNGLFVAVAASGTDNRVMTSPDGNTWTTRTSAADNDWQSVCYGEVTTNGITSGLFVAVAISGTGNRVMTSPDGITWTIRTSAADNTWVSVCYGNGKFVAVSQSGTGPDRIMFSSDGMSWACPTSLPVNDAFGLASVCYGNGVFVAVCMNGTTRVMVSSNGETWDRKSCPPISWGSVCYGAGLFVAVAYGGTNRVMTSSNNGATWTSRSAPSDDWISVCYGNGLFVAVTYTGKPNTDTIVGGYLNTMTSTNGTLWTLKASPSSNSWLSVCYGDGLYVATAFNGDSNRIMTNGVFSCYYKTAEILCFIDNEEKYICISDIKEGDLVKTYKHGYVKVSLIGKMPCISSPNGTNTECLYKLKNGSLIVSGGHYLLVDELPENLKYAFYSNNITIDDKKILLTCDSNDFEKVEEIMRTELYHLVLESESETQQYGIYANNVLTESCSRKYFLSTGFT
jgi:hypothetical protein